ncbi:hypothetical protein AaE_015531 [Aphanomyces astaci]|uniref:Uncharacterized protein n=1 Tax=Aphanomyces astaci TaxID=112090 RepID=A0A6A4Z7G2_APHAT|nr:hypothetical protein AaE_015531 [Aphanomyces astaci]
MSLSAGMEDDLREWALAIQARRMPVTADEMIDRGTKTLVVVTPGAMQKRRWYAEFETLYIEIKDAIEVVVNDGDRVFNIDKMGFAPKCHANNVIAQLGPTNVWSEEASLNFHMTIVGCIGAKGTVISPVHPARCNYPGRCVRSIVGGPYCPGINLKWFHELWVVWCMAGDVCEGRR